MGAALGGECAYPRAPCDEESRKAGKPEGALASREISSLGRSRPRGGTMDTEVGNGLSTTGLANSVAGRLIRDGLRDQRCNTCGRGGRIAGSIRLCAALEHFLHLASSRQYAIPQ
jgi:hypothetical protein